MVTHGNTPRLDLPIIEKPTNGTAFVTNRTVVENWPLGFIFFLKDEILFQSLPTMTCDASAQGRTTGKARRKNSAWVAESGNENSPTCAATTRKEETLLPRLLTS